MFYVGMSRAREENTAHVVTGPPDPAGLSRAEREAFAREGLAQASELLARGDAEAARAVPLVAPEPEGMRDRAPWESVVAEVMHHDDPAEAALEQIKHGLFAQAKTFLQDHTISTLDRDEFFRLCSERAGMIDVPWCGRPECEEIVKEATSASTRNLREPARAERCVPCGEPARYQAYFAQAY